MHRSAWEHVRRGRSMTHGRGHGYPHRSPRARRGDVRSAVLSLLDERAMHGYELIQEIEARTGGRWRPSAGSIYPTLQLLEDEGLVSPEEVDGKRVYSLTAGGKKAAADIVDRRRPWQGDEDSPRHELRAEAIRLRAALQQFGQAGDDDQVARAAKLLAETRRSLYGILAED